MGKIKERVTTRQLRKVLDEVEDAEYGHTSHVDDETSRMIKAMKHTTIEERKKKLEENRQKMRDLFTATRGRTEELTKDQPEHVRRVQGHLDIGFLQGLAEAIGHKDTGLFENMVKGSPTVGPIQDSNIWLTDPFHQKKNDIKEAERKKNFKLRKSGPEWMSAENKKRLWEESAALRESDLVREVKGEDVKMEPTYGFGVEQGDFIVREDESRYYVKLRNCFDYRGVNKWSPSKEKLKLTTNKQIIQWVAEAAVHGDSKPPPILPGKKDVTADIEEELGKVLATEAEIVEDIQNWLQEQAGLSADNGDKKISELKTRLNKSKKKNVKRRLERKFYQTKRETRRTKLESGKGRGFIPGFCKLDFKSYYYQFAAMNMNENIIAIWDPTEYDESSKGRWRYFESSVMHFGNLHSVYVACRFSLLLEEIIRKFLEIIASIYIDDSIVMERFELLKLAQEIVEELYEKIGWKMSTGKLETQVTDAAIRILGIVYERFSWGFKFYPPEIKVQETVAKMDRYMEEIKHGTNTFEELEKLTGSLIFLLQVKFIRISGCEMKTLGAWKPEENFVRKSLIPAEVVILLEAFKKLRKDLLEGEPAEISIVNMNTERIHLYTDAATGENGLDNSFIGGILRGEYCDHAFSYHVPLWLCNILKKKSAMSSLNIGVLEALAVWAALLVFDDLIGDKWVVLHVDNTGVIYSFTSGGAMCSATQGIVNAVSMIQCNKKRRAYFCYIRSAKNIADATTRKEKVSILEETLEKTQWRSLRNYIGDNRLETLWSGIESAKFCRRETRRELEKRKENMAASRIGSLGRSVLEKNQDGACCGSEGLIKGFVKG